MRNALGFIGLPITLSREMMTEEILTIRTERTPNPDSLKYNVGGKILLASGSANFPTKESAERSPLAKRLFMVQGIVGVFIGTNFITLTKDESKTWPQINEFLAPKLEEFFDSDEPVLEGAAPVAEKEIGADTANPELVQKIKDLINEKIRPAVAQDGGDITYRGYEEGVVFVSLQGACSGCPSSTVTLKDGIERMLIHYLAEDVKEVRAI